MMRVCVGLTRGSWGVGRYGLSMLTDYFTKKNAQKQEDQFKKEMEYLANKPIFTLMDYKQRINDELAKAKGNLKAKFNQEAQEQTEQLEMEKKVFNCMFEDELNMETRLKASQREEIALVAQLEVDFITKTLRKFEEYKAMHKMLRQLKLNNEPLPESMREFQQMFLASGMGRNSKKMKYAQYKHHPTIVKNRWLKRQHDHGYFF